MKAGILFSLCLAGYLVALWGIGSKSMMTDLKAMQLEADYKATMGAQYAGR
jgi:hypothetical protein